MKSSNLLFLRNNCNGELFRMLIIVQCGCGERRIKRQNEYEKVFKWFSLYCIDFVLFYYFISKFSIFSNKVYYDDNWNEVN